MKKLLKFILMIFAILLIASCNSKKERMEIKVGELVEVVSDNFPDYNREIVYAWGPPKFETGDIPKFEIDRSSLYFTPEKPGFYDVTLTIESLGGEMIIKENFYYIAVDGSVVSNNKNKPTQSKKIDIDTKPKSNNKTDTIKDVDPVLENYFTVQVYSRPNKSQAKTDLSMLTDLGFEDVYLEEFLYSDTLYWRVRSGKFNSSYKAEKHKKEIAKVLEIDSKNLWDVEVK